MKTIIKLFVIITFTLIIFSCTRTYPFVKRSAGFPPADSVYARYAVLDFDYHGHNINKKIADRAADQLSNELYSTLSLPVAERSIVRAAQKKFKTTKNTQITQNEIAKIAEETQSDFIVLGTLRLLGSVENVFEITENEIELNVRFIDVQTGELVCIIQEKRYSDASLESIIHQSVLRSVDRLKMELK